MLRFLCTALLVIFSVKTISQTIRLNRISAEIGLSEPTNSFIYQDKKGYVWISSMNGLNRFDGRINIVFQPNEHEHHAIFGRNILSSFFEDDNGDIWFTTYENSSISVLRRQLSYFDHYIIPLKKTSEPDEYTAFFLERNRWLWTLANNQLFRFDTKSSPQYKSQYLHELTAIRFAVDTFTDGIVKRVTACYWSYKKGMEIIDYDKNAQPISRHTYFSESEKKQMPLLTIQYALIENDSLIWLATDKGLVAFNPKQPYVFKIFSLNEYGKTVRHLVMDNNRRLFVSTDKTPLLTFDKTTHEFVPLSFKVKNQDDDFNPMQNGANELYIDKSNTLWLSVKKEGLYYTPLKKQLFVNPIIFNGINLKSINQILEDRKGEIWAVANSNIYQFGNNKKEISHSNFTLKPYLTVGDDGYFWSVSTKGLLQYFNNKANDVKTILEKPEQEFICITPIDKFSLLVGSNHDLFYFDITDKSLTSLKLNTFIDQIILDKFNSFWCSTGGQKIINYQLNEDKSIKKRFEIVDKGIVSHFHNSLLDSAIIWASTSKGILKINTLKLTDTLLTEKDGLPNVIFQAVLEDKNGNLWCSSNHGIGCYNPKSKLYRQFTQQDGLSADAYNANAALLSSTGEMWFGSINGIDVFHPDSIRNISQPPQLAVSGLKIYDKYWNGDTAINMANHVNLKYYENTLTFELSAMEYTNPINNKFKVQMEGYDREWVNLNTQNFVTYINLPTGNYTFKFTACNSEGIWNDNPRILHLTIRPPFWKTWWFILLCIIATMTLVGYIVYLRLSKIIDLQEIRIKLYENLHDDLGSRLTAIVMMIDPLLQDIKRQKTAESTTNEYAQIRTLSDIKNIGRSIVGNMHRLVWATDPSNDELSNVVVQMRKDREILLPRVQLIINIEDGLAKAKIDGNIRYQMLSIFNEALTNISKYAEATIVTVEFTCEDDMFSMSINDNGKGFDANTPNENNPLSGGNGFRNMRNRAKRINGKLTVSSKIGFGTKIVLTFSMIKASFWKRLKESFSKFLPK